MSCVRIAAPNNAIITSSTTSQMVSSSLGAIHFCVIHRIAAPVHKMPLLLKCARLPEWD
jgi:hypothetical protein